MFADKLEQSLKQENTQEPVIQNQPTFVEKLDKSIKQSKPFYDVTVDPEYLEGDGWGTKVANSAMSFGSGVTHFAQGLIDPVLNVLSYLPIESLREYTKNIGKRSASRAAGNFASEVLLGGRILGLLGKTYQGGKTLLGFNEAATQIPKSLGMFKPVAKIGSAGVEGALGGAVTGHLFSPYEEKNTGAAKGAVIGGVVGTGLGAFGQAMQSMGQRRYLKQLLKNNEQKNRILEEEISGVKKQYNFDNDLSVADNIEKRKIATKEEIDNLEKEAIALQEEIKNINDNNYTFDRTQPTNIKNPKKQLMNDAINDTPVDLGDVETIIEDAISNNVRVNPNLAVYPSFKSTKEKLPKKINKIIKNAAHRQRKQTGEDPTLSAVEYFLNNFNDAGSVPHKSFTHAIKNDLAKYVYNNLEGEQERALYAAMRTANKNNKAIYTDFPKNVPSDIQELENELKKIQQFKEMQKSQETQASRDIKNLQTKMQESNKVKDSNAKIRDALHGGRSYKEALSDKEKIILNRYIRNNWTKKYYSLRALLNALGKNYEN